MVRVSIIIPTFNRHESLRTTLAKLIQQTMGPVEFEVVVVDDGSTDDTPLVQHEAYAYPVKYCRQDNRGSCFARNLGAAMSQGSILIFLDDDMSPEPDYIRQLARAHELSSDVIVCGAMYPFVGGAMSPFDRFMTTWYSTVWSPSGSESRFVHYTHCTSNNLSIRRDIFFRVGGWRDVCGDGQTLWGDVEFGYRANGYGVKVCYCPKAICYHRDYASHDLKSQCSRLRGTAALSHDLFRLYPELEVELEMFRDMSRPRWEHDSLSLIFRKLLRALSATDPMLHIQEQLVPVFERTAPSSKLLNALYRWIIGAHTYRGYRSREAVKTL